MSREPFPGIRLLVDAIPVSAAVDATYVELPQDAEILRETDRAYLLSWERGSMLSDAEVWVPKRAVAVIDGHNSRRGCVKKWVVARNNLWGAL